MKRALLIVLALGVVLLAVVVGLYVVRTRATSSAASSSSTAQDPMPSMPAASPATTGASQSTPRGDVTIDPRRQQLIGVKTVPVMRQTLDQTVRAAGMVRYDETKQADVN